MSPSVTASTLNKLQKKRKRTHVEEESERFSDGSEAVEAVTAVPPKAQDISGRKDSREAHRQQKKLKSERKTAKPKGELVAQAKKIWERLRPRDLDQGTRRKIMAEMMELIGGSISEITFKHDASRIIQTCMKYGSQEERDRIAEELSTNYLELSKSLYGRFILLRMLKYCPKYRDRIIESFYGHVRKLVRHKDASVVIEECYSLYAKAHQRAALVQEFYGPEFAIFKDTSAGAKTPKGLSAILEGSPSKKDAILSHIKQALLPLIAKGTVHHSIVHSALLDYFKFASEKACHEMAEEIKDYVVEILHTKDGAQVGALCFLYGTPKARKAILKSFKPYIQKICCEEHGHAVLLQALDTIDDTVFVEKAIISELRQLIPNLIPDLTGRRILMYMVVGRCSRYIGHHVIQALNEGDTIRAKTSKKNSAVRRAELVKAISPALLEWVRSEIEDILADPVLCQSATDIVLFCQGNKEGVVERIVEVLDKYDSEDVRESHPFMDQVANRFYSSLIKADRALPKLSDPDVPVLEGNPQFSPQIMAHISEETLRYLAERGRFPVLALLESPLTGQAARSALLSHKARIEAAAKSAEHSQTVYAGILKALL
ncbi:Pumilio y domain member 6 [Spiromyces aspiralis]|uniref:Pumilio y domain member 6 n=1 Tax=Spiromyces aspiralis TaxID=68401 RepID=A0ACC1HQU1_9FUNG|nr:Pumilio y domain member 6 [Spiromyces aspiralis]